MIRLIILIYFLACAFQVAGQNVDSLERVLRRVYGLEKLQTLNQLVDYYNRNDPGKRGLKLGREAVMLGENLFVESNAVTDESQLIQLTKAYFQLAEILYKREDYFSAQEYFASAKNISIEMGKTTYLDDIDRYSKDIQAKIDRGEIKEGFFSKAFGDLDVAELIKEGSRDVKIKSEIGIARMYENKRDFDEAINHYNQAINMLRDKGDTEQIAELRLKVGVLFDSLKQYEMAQDYLGEAIQEADSVENVIETDQQKKNMDRGGEDLTLQDSLVITQKNLKKLSEQYARENNLEKSMEYFQLYQQLTQKMESDSLQMLALNKRRESELLLLKQQKNIADLKVEAAQLEEQQAKILRNRSVAIALVILLGILITLYFYLMKRQQHRRLSEAYSDLNTTKGKLEDAEQKIVKLLHQQVSGEVAQALLSQKGEHPVARKFVCIMFLDIRDFTPRAEKMNPEELIAFQNRIFGFMIDIVEKHHGTLNQLLGDGFMATFGAPASYGNDCLNAYSAAREILEELQKRNDAGDFADARVGIGLHAGNVVTGNVGNEARKQYSVTGNPVITASRVEQLNKQYHSQLIITREVFEQLNMPLPHGADFIEVRVKGRTEPVSILTIA